MISRYYPEFKVPGSIGHGLLTCLGVHLGVRDAVASAIIEIRIRSSCQYVACDITLGSVEIKISMLVVHVITARVVATRVVTTT